MGNLGKSRLDSEFCRFAKGFLDCGLQSGLPSKTLGEQVGDCSDGIVTVGPLLTASPIQRPKAPDRCIVGRSEKTYTGSYLGPSM
jgi:hypothetical protein